MKFRKIGRTNLRVSEICLGTMNFGEQVSEADAHQQLDYAVSRGINFIDTAEIYPIPPNEDSQGRTESYIGSWLKKRGRRDDLIIASKVVGRDESLSYIRNREYTLCFDRKNIRHAIADSLKRLGTDYIDLYQLHWPDRDTNYFGKRDYKHNPTDKFVPIEETLRALDELVQEGLVRHIGISNENSWGIHEYLRQSELNNLPRIQSIQNAYSLIMREYENSLEELCIRENISLLAYSPLAFGVLTGKYLGHKSFPPGSRFHYAKGRNAPRYNPPHAQTAIKKYVDLAKRFNVDPAQMAIAFVLSQTFITSTIIGATNMEQLKADIDSVDLKLSGDLLSEIAQIHLASPNPIT